jgi:hypothetical protein
MMDEIGMGQLAYALRGVSYPVPWWRLLAWADYNAMNGQLRAMFWTGRYPRTWTARGFARVLPGGQGHDRRA